MTNSQHNKTEQAKKLTQSSTTSLHKCTEVEVVFLHGWGMNKGIWEHFIPFCKKELRQQKVAQSPDIEFCFSARDLPGFGENADMDISEATLREIAEKIYAQLNRPTIIVGWSLGGLLAQILASDDFPLVIAQIQLASTPKFVESEQWPGIKLAVLNDFHRQLNKNQRLLLKRFVAIQCMGLANAKSIIKEVTDLLAQYPNSSKSSLRASLNLLIKSDLRFALNTSHKPCLRIYGRLDSLVPSAVIPLIDKLDPQSQSVIINKASHAPFISHAEQCASLIINFVNTLKFD